MVQTLNSPRDPKAEFRKLIIIWAIIGAVAGAFVGALGIDQPGVHIGYGLLGMLLGAAACTIVVLVVYTAFQSIPASFQYVWLFALYSMFLAGIVWEQKLDNKLSAWGVGLVTGVITGLVVAYRERVARAINRERPPSDSTKPS